MHTSDITLTRENTSIRERIRLLADEGRSIFAARRSEFPQDDNGAIQERLLGC